MYTNYINIYLYFIFRLEKFERNDGRHFYRVSLFRCTSRDSIRGMSLQLSLLYTSVSGGEVLPRIMTNSYYFPVANSLTPLT